MRARRPSPAARTDRRSLVLLLAALALSACRPEPGPEKDGRDSGSNTDTAGDTAGTVADTDSATDTGRDTQVDTSETDETGETGDTAPPEPDPGVDLDDVGAVKLVGELPSDGNGYLPVAPAGDLNGDGQLDVLVGSSNSDVAGFETGSAYVAFGPFEADRSLADADVILRGAEGEHLGAALIGGGDVNADGFSDLLVSAIGYEREGASSPEGAVYLLLGPLDATSAMADWDALFIGEAHSEYSPGLTGQYVDFAGDVDGDGFDDVLVNQPNYGDVYVMRGPVEGSIELATDADVHIDVQSGTYDISSAGDTDGDGLDDLITTDYLNEEEYLQLYTGPLTESMTTADATATWSHAFGDDAGRSLTGAGDCNGDGYADIAVGVTGAADVEYGAGAVYVFEGPMAGAAGFEDAGTEIRGDVRVAGVGTSVDKAGDVNGDGFADLVIGAPRLGSSSDYVSDGPGAAYVAFGPFVGSPYISEVATRINGEAHDEFGNAVAGLGDVDGDGLDDVSVNAREDNEAGYEAGATWILHAADLPW